MTEPKPSHGRKLKKRWIILSAVPVTLVALGVVVALLLNTESGLHRLLQVVQATAPGALSWESASGRLIGPLQLNGVKYKDATGEYRIAQIVFDWAPGRLLARRLSIHQLHVSDVAIELAASEAPAEQAPINPGWTLPLEIVLRDVAVHKLSIKTGAAEPVLIESLVLAVSSGLEWLDIEQLHVESALLTLAAQGRVGLGRQVLSDVALDWTLRAQGYAPVTATGQLSGSWEGLQLTQNLSAPVAAQARIKIVQPFAQLRWILELDAPVTLLTAINAHWPAQRIGGKLRGSGSLTDAQLSADLSTDWAAQDLFPLRAEVTLVTADNGSLQLQPLLLQQGDAHLRLTGNWLAATQRFSASLEAKDFNWPLLGESQLHVPEAKMQVSGTLQEYQATLSGHIAGVDVPASTLQAAAHGDQDALHLDQLEIHSLEGVLRSQGRLAWAPRLNWEMQVDATDINPGAQWPEWPGKLHAQLKSSGNEGAQGLELVTDIAQLGGQLRGYPVKGVGKLSLQNETLQVDAVQLQSGDARLAVQGSVARTWDLSWSLLAPELRQLSPELAGSVDSTGTLSGARSQPRVQTQTHVRAFKMADISLAKLQLDADMNMQPGAALDIKGRGKDLRIAKRRFDSLSMDLNGKLDQHTVSVQAKGRTHKLQLALLGGWNGQRWSGQLERGDWQLPELGAWTLKQPINLALAADSGAIERVCWKQASTALCAQLDYTPKERHLQAELTDWPLASLQEYFPPGVQIESAALAAQVNAHWPAQATPRAAAQLQLSPGSVRWTDAGQTVATPFGGADVDFKLDASGLRSSAQLRLSGADQLSLNASVPGYDVSAAVPAQALQGQLRGSVNDFSLVNALVKDIDALSGALTLDADLAGTLSNPSLHGELRLKDARGFIGPAGVQLEDWQATLSGDPLDGSLRLRSSARSGPGMIDLTGRLAHFGSADLEGELHLGGSGFEAVNLPEARILVTPDLTCKVQARTAHVSGTLLIPEARIEPRDLSAVVTVSKDVVLVSQDAPPPPGWIVNSQISVSLGEKVKFNGYGLQGRLSGALDVTDKPGRVPRGRGELAIKDGLYTTYGQELKIETGRVLYRDSPLDNPGLDVRATRKTGAVTAGVRILGDAQDPVAELYSQPTLPQADMLSYLLLGRPLANASGGEGEMLFKAATSLGLKGGNALAENIGNTFGLDEVSVGGDNGMGSAALTLGKYLSPRLYVNYSVGLLDAANRLQMRYQLNKRLLLQTETGTATGGDILYTLER